MKGRGMTKKMLLMIAVALVALLVATSMWGQGLASTPVPGWQCLPYAGTAEYTIDGSCTNHAPAFVYAGDGQVVLAYAVLTLAEDVDANCFYGHAGWSPVEFNTEGVAENVGAHVLRGENVEIKLIPGAPADQACLLVRQPAVQVRLRTSRIDDQHLLLTAESMAFDRAARGKK